AAVRPRYLTASGAEKILRRVGAKPSLICAIAIKSSLSDLLEIWVFRRFVFFSVAPARPGQGLRSFVSRIFCRLQKPDPDLLTKRTKQSAGPRKSTK